MKFAKKILIGLVLISCSSVFAAGGTDVGVLFGVKNASYDNDTAGANFNSKAGFMGGVLAVGEMGGLLFRTGGYYASRATEVKSTTLSSADLTVATIDVPVTLLYQFNEMLGLFGGALFALKVSDDCAGEATICASVSDEIKSFYTAATVGLNAKFHPNWSGEIFYEHGLSDIAKDTTVNAISLGVVFVY